MCHLLDAGAALRLADHDNGGPAIKYHLDDYAESEHFCAACDLEHEPCTDDDCDREHVHVLTADEYDAINRWIRSSHYGDALDDLEPDDYIARALAEHHSDRGGGATPGPAD